MKKKYLIGGIVLTLVLTIGGITYAYWLSGIQGEGANMNVTLDLDGASVIFTDTTEIAETGVKPGWETPKTFTIENTNVVPFSYDIYIKDLVNTLVSEGFLQYKINSSNGYDMGEEYAPIDKSATPIDFDLATRITIPANTTQEYTISIRYYNSPDVDQSEDKGKSFSGRLMIRENSGKTLYSTLTDGVTYSTVKTRKTGDFDTSLCGETDNVECDTTGVIYKENTFKEDGLDVYYFAGNPLDNWIKFGKEGDKDIYWRIIRTNEDGSIRLLYAGNTPNTTEGYIKDGNVYEFAYNTIYDNTIGVGYKYGTTGSLSNNRQNTNDSNAKKILEKWYETNLGGIDEYINLISEKAIYCNDRSGEDYNSSTTMYYSGYERIGSNSLNRPTYKCGGKTDNSLYSDASNKDKFSVINEEAKLKYPVGLMTADEIVFAGGKWGENISNVYCYNNNLKESVTGSTTWWTMTSYNFEGSSTSWVFTGDFYKYIWAQVVGANQTLRPVLSLKSSVLVSKGNGTWQEPYELTLE